MTGASVRLLARPQLDNNAQSPEATGKTIRLPDQTTYAEYLEQMKTYPRLTEMGVLHPQQICSFSVNSIDYIDVLRIVYCRPKGSILPMTRTYKFPRVQKSAKIGDVAAKKKTVMESDPALREAVEELKALMKSKKQKEDVADSILEELRLLEEDIALRTEYVKELVSKMKAV